MSTLHLGFRAFVCGLAIGVLVAPRPGWQSRRILRERVLELIDAMAERLALPETPVSVPDRSGSSRGS